MEQTSGGLECQKKRIEQRRVMDERIRDLGSLRINSATWEKEELTSIANCTWSDSGVNLRESSHGRESQGE